MRATLAVITTIGLFVFLWGVAAIVLWLVLSITPANILGENINYLINKLLVWVLAPGIGAYFGVKYSSRWFSNVRVEIISAGFLATLLTLTLIVIGFNIFFFITNKSATNEWLELIGVIAQVAAAVVGANIAKSKQSISQKELSS